ncbi:uncharacterized protein LOC131435424 [Malaya genurostris]|uniref:uncharacterized protein LOC131435424 n=1 Tax=Malaya genurostris TaxID=325434 RepID=UPI0026F38FF5|nr:uncharacterized protein LOC131435424 [Malaya genurostris]
MADNSLFLNSINNLSFASLHVPECKAIDNEEEIDRKSFEQWKELLDASMIPGVADEQIKFSIFKIKAGPKLLDIFEGTKNSINLPPEDEKPYSNAISRLKEFFGSRDYCRMQRQKLRSMAQGSVESDLKYVKRIVNVAKLCDYSEDVMIENVLDVIQSHAINPVVREIGRKKMRKCGSLADLLGKVRACEISRINEDLFAKNHQQTNHAELAAVSTHTENGFKSRSQNRFHSKDGFPKNVFAKQQNGTCNPCWRCTSTYHLPAACHAVDKFCRNCQKKGHIARACRETVPAPSKRYNNNNDNPVPKVHKLLAITKDSDNDDSESNPQKYNEVYRVNDLYKHNDNEGIIIPISFLIDSGAEDNTISTEYSNRLLTSESAKKNLA